METNRSIENINREASSLQEQINRLEQDNMKLKNEIDVQTKEIEVCKDFKKSKAMVEENLRLKDDVEVLSKRLDTNKEIIDSMRLSMEKIRKESTPDLNSDHIVELYAHGLSVLKISQLCNTTKTSIINTLMKAGKYQVEQGLEKQSSSR